MSNTNQEPTMATLINNNKNSEKGFEFKEEDIIAFSFLCINNVFNSTTTNPHQTPQHHQHELCTTTTEPKKLFLEATNHSPTTASMNFPQSPSDNVQTPPSSLEAKEGTSASALQPLQQPTLCRSVADHLIPSPSSNNTVTQETPRSKKLQRLKDCMRKMREWSQAVMLEDIDIDTDRTNNNNTATLKDNSDIDDFDRSVSVERKGGFLVVHVECPCGKYYKVRQCEEGIYYKLN